MEVIKAPVALIEQLDDFDDEYVYDIGVSGDSPYVFANNILVHNSCYFTVAHLLDGDTKPTREEYITMYDMIADTTNDSFPRFMDETFNTGLKRGAIIAAGRELVASKMLFIKKKKYGGLIYELEGDRHDIGKTDASKMIYPDGKLKVMGLDLKRADTPKFMQTFLEKILLDILRGVGEDEVVKQIRDFRIAFKERPAWEKGSPKKVNNLTKYRKVLEKIESMGVDEKRTKHDSTRTMIPGHVRASLNWNHMCDIHNDKYSMRATDGSRIIVCRLRPNHTRMKEIAFPIDELHLPNWFKELPFDHAAMEEIIIDKKVTNLVEVLKWNLNDTKIISGEEFFTF